MVIFLFSLFVMLLHCGFVFLLIYIDMSFEKGFIYWLFFTVILMLFYRPLYEFFETLIMKVEKKEKEKEIEDPHDYTMLEKIENLIDSTSMFFMVAHDIDQNSLYSKILDFLPAAEKHDNKLTLRLFRTEIEAQEHMPVIMMSDMYILGNLSNQISGWKVVGLNIQQIHRLFSIGTNFHYIKIGCYPDTRFLSVEKFIRLIDSQYEPLKIANHIPTSYEYSKEDIETHLNELTLDNTDYEASIKEYYSLSEGGVSEISQTIDCHEKTNYYNIYSGDISQTMIYLHKYMSYMQDRIKYDDSTIKSLETTIFENDNLLYIIFCSSFNDESVISETVLVQKKSNNSYHLYARENMFPD